MNMVDVKHIGERMHVARLWLGQSQAQVAQNIGISPDTYKYFEGGSRTQLHKLEKISEVLCVSERWLMRGPLPQVPAAELSFRKRVALKSPDILHVRAMACYVEEFRYLIDRFVKLPPVRLPSIPIQSNDFISIENTVAELRAAFGMGDAPLRNAIDLAESLGVLVFWVSSPDTFDGVSFWLGEQPYILLNSSHLDGYRCRFTILHELGHLMLHRSSSTLADKEEESKRMESEANYFASALLMPGNAFARKFPRFGNLSDILEERSYWRVSCAAMIRRAKDLHLIDEDRYRKLNIHRSAKGWQKREPGAMKPEQSKIHSYFLDEAGEVGLTAPKLAQEIECGLSWFTEGFPQAVAYQSEFSFDFA
jgi:Zn-dependent peptidase ImmA (M78 family)/transcriptional regulator with XRE-family HTH domain